MIFLSPNGICSLRDYHGAIGSKQVDLKATQPCPNSHWNTKAAKKEVAILELNLSYRCRLFFEWFSKFKSMQQQLLKFVSTIGIFENKKSRHAMRFSCFPLFWRPEDLKNTGGDLRTETRGGEFGWGWEEQGQVIYIVYLGDEQQPSYMSIL